MSKAERCWALSWALVIVGLACLPYLAVWGLAPEGTQFTGLLVNPLDGASYLAKMRLGAQGAWLFHLTYTPEDHSGALVYPFYLLLGKLAALTRLPIPLVYHLARAAAGLWLLLLAYRFVARCIDTIPARRAAFLLIGLSAGLGWLLVSLGYPADRLADLWVAEGFTFLSLLVNPHFPLAMALMILVLIIILDIDTDDGQLVRRLAAIALASVSLALVHVLAVPTLLAIIGVYTALRAWQQRRIPKRLLWAGLVTLGATGPVLLYDTFVFRSNPAMAAWSAQNITKSLAPWDYALGYGLVLLLALAGTRAAWARRRPADVLLLAWPLATVVLIYLPLTMQRRLITGLHVPLAVLAAMGLATTLWPRIRTGRALVTGLVIGLTMLTSILVPISAVAGAMQGQQPLVADNDDAAAWDWLREHSVWTDTVLAPAESGALIPAWAGNRVVYGHPFETIDAATKKAEVAQFFSPTATAAERQAVLSRYKVRYVYCPGATGAAFSDSAAALGLTLTWSGEQARLYQAGGGP